MNFILGSHRSASSIENSTAKICFVSLKLTWKRFYRKVVSPSFTFRNCVSSFGLRWNFVSNSLIIWLSLESLRKTGKKAMACSLIILPVELRIFQVKCEWGTRFQRPQLALHWRIIFHASLFQERKVFAVRFCFQPCTKV